MFPLYDEQRPNIERPYVVLSLIFINVLVFFLTYDANFQTLGLVPSNIYHGRGLYSFLTYPFLHGSVDHLIGNMWFLWIFGDNLEDFLGHFKFLLLYVLCAVFSGIFFVVTVDAQNINMPVIGASGAISGLLGAYLTTFYDNRIVTIFFFKKVYWKAYYYIILWFLIQLFSFPDKSSLVAYSAHVGGFIFGFILMLILRINTRRVDYRYGHEVYRKDY